MNILTFDIEDWFTINDSTWMHHTKWNKLTSRIDDNVKTILNLLEENDTKATFFILGWVAEQFPELIKEIDRRGHEIGYHSYYHMRPQRQTAEEFEEDLQNGLELIQNIISKPVLHYRAPNLSITDNTKWIYPILARNGIKTSSSVKSFQSIKSTLIQNKPVIVKTIDGNILEFPLNRIDMRFFRLIYSGSGFFRLVPTSILQYLFRKDLYNMLYFHPRDFDPNVPIHPKLSPWRNWKQRVNSRTTLPKLSRLMQLTIFHTISSAADTYQHMKLQEIDMVPKYPFRKVG